MSHIGDAKDWDGLLEFYLSSPEYVPSLKKITIAQWLFESRDGDGGGPGTHELAANAVNFCGLMYNRRMEAFGCGKYEYKGQDFCKFDDVEHFVDGYFYFISSGGYDKWHQLAHRPVDFIAHLQEKGFAGSDDQYTAKIKKIYDEMESGFDLKVDEQEAVRHTVLHGDYVYKIAEKYGVVPNRVFELERSGILKYGSGIGVLHTGDLLYVLTGGQPAAAGAATDPLAAFRPCESRAGDCAGRTHFVIHQTVDGNLTRQRVLDRFGGRRNKGHVYILKSGEAVFLWQFTEKRVYVTKAETPGAFQPGRGSYPNYPLLGKMIHVEIDYEADGEPTREQYQTLALLYIEACRTVERVLTIVPHIEVDRGIRGGHHDPDNFNYNHFYGVLAGRGVDVNRIPKFDHDRYWGRRNYRIPFDTDTFHFPPILTGNPHA